MTQTPQFSILFPTRDRLELLVSAVETVRAQSFTDWEIIIADNASTTDIKAYVDGLQDPRILYLRSDVSLPVTENWNRAINASSGQYVTMLGDDDGLVPDYFSRFQKYIDDLEQPDLIYHGAYHFAFPNTLKDAPEGFLQNITPIQRLFKGKYEPEILPRAEAEIVAKAALDLQLLFSFNMQYFIFKREFLEKMRRYGPVFQGPYPDFYAAPLSFLIADKIGIVPQPMTVIGISPKSYGFHHFNNDENTAVKNLNNENYAEGMDSALAARLLPGSAMNSQWLASVALVQKNLHGQIDLELGIGRYRLLQVLNTILGPFVQGKDWNKPIKDMWEKLDTRERALSHGLRAALWPAKILPQSMRNNIARVILSMTGQYERFSWIIRVLVIGVLMKLTGVAVQKPWSAITITRGQKSVRDVYNFLCRIEGKSQEC